MRCDCDTPDAEAVIGAPVYHELGCASRIESLFGQDGDEHLYRTAAEWYEHWCDMRFDPIDHDRHVHFDEFSVREPQSHFRDPETALELMVEFAGENEVDEHWYAEAEAASKHLDVIAAYQNVLNLIAKRIAYRMADRVIAHHVISWTPDGRPLLDGEPMYVKREIASDPQVTGGES